MLMMLAKMATLKQFRNKCYDVLISDSDQYVTEKALSRDSKLNCRLS